MGHDYIEILFVPRGYAESHLSNFLTPLKLVFFITLEHYSVINDLRPHVQEQIRNITEHYSTNH